MTSIKEFIATNAFWEGLVDNLFHKAYDFGFKLLACIVIYIVGRKLIKYINFIVNKLLNRQKLDPSIVSFLKSLISIVLTVVLLITIISVLGIPNSSFVAILASAGVALGMALSGTLQNFAGGIMILLFRPYQIGDYILAQNQEGTVKSIQIFNTVIVTADNRTIYIPNGTLSNNTIINNTSQSTRRVEWTIGIDYGSDYDNAKSVVQSILKSDKRILSNPAPYIALKNLNESSIDILIRVWVNSPDFWDVFYDINEQIYKLFALNGINIPFPQMTVHLADTSRKQN
ncbi:mechanosensitive ion channel protein [Bacteroidia bacterium]|nr:mechanosensitive ion channel protein [Bacteroidia bacterium]